MASVWTVKGEAGATVDATVRTLPALAMQEVSIEFASLAPDSMRWTVWLDDPADTAQVPDHAQRMTLYRDGVRYFTGWVTVRRPLFTAARYGYQIAVEGPWYFLARTSISSLVPDQSTVASERASYVFPTATVRTSLLALIDRAITLGMPISHGAIASAFAIPRLSLREMSFAEAFSELMRWLPDGRMYFDYSGEDSAWPALSMQRRTAASTITLVPDQVCIPRISLEPRHDLKVEEISIFHARRETLANERVTTWQTQTAGAQVSALPARQLITTAGPELDLFLPQDFTDSVEVVSAPVLSGGALRPQIFLQYDARLRASGLLDVSLGPWTDAQRVGGPAFELPSVAQSITDADGNAIDSSYSHYLTTGAPRDWWVKDGIEHVMARITATVYVWNLNEPDPDWVETVGGFRVYRYLVSVGGSLYQRNLFALTVTVTVPLVKTSWPVPTTLIRAEDWGWYNPPEDLAANLLAAQNFVPMDGEVPVVLDDVPAGNAVGQVVNISEFLPETANMRALVSGYSVRPATGQISYTLGSPDRFAFRDLVNRFRQSGADNIYYLLDQVSGDAGGNPAPDPELGIPADVPADAILFGGEALTYNGQYITYTPDAVLYPPDNTVLPTIIGTAEPGETLTYVPGTWTGADSVTWEWYLNGVATAETGGTYLVPAEAENADEITVRETATNDDGPDTAESLPTVVVVIMDPPVNTVLPAITGTAEPGETLTYVPGTWTGADTVTWEWYLNGVATAETGGTYAISGGAADGDAITILETATNAGGPDTAESGAAVVAVPDPLSQDLAEQVNGTLSLSGIYGTAYPQDLTEQVNGTLSLSGIYGTAYPQDLTEQVNGTLTFTGSYV